MLNISNDKYQKLLSIHQEKRLNIVNLDDLSFIEWEAIISSFRKLATEYNYANCSQQLIITEQLLTEQFRQELLNENPVLRLIEAIFCQATHSKYHLMHIKKMGLKQFSYTDQCIGFAAISLALGLPLAADKSTGQVVWDIMDRKEKKAPYQTFSEGKGEADYHTDTAFYEKPVRNFALHCIKPAECGGGVNRFCNAAALRQKLIRDPEHAWIVKTLTGIPATFRVPSSFTHHKENECIDAFIFGDDVPVRFRLDSIHKGHELKYGRQNNELLKAIDALMHIVDNPDNMLKMRLEEDAAVFINNYEVLHYRDDFMDPSRHLMRIWIK